jgi:SAM-dependent methyltransferase
MQPFTGSGLGAQAPDGCSVELYRRIPYLGELDALLPQFPPRGHVLELGCGTGRLCTRLVEAGFVVTGVDHSSAMLAHLAPGIERVAAEIGTLALDRRFDVVLLAGCLINHGDARARTRFLQAARRHLDAGGLLVIQRHDADWLRSAAAGATSEIAGGSMAVEHVARAGDRVDMILRYRVGGLVWRHAFSAVALDEADVETLARAASFSAIRWYGEDRLWAIAAAA